MSDYHHHHDRFDAAKVRGHHHTSPDPNHEHDIWLAACTTLVCEDVASAVGVLQGLTWHEVSRHQEFAGLRHVLRGWRLTEKPTDEVDGPCERCNPSPAAGDSPRSDALKDWLDESVPGVVHVRRSKPSHLRAVPNE